jgi:hypothetical protein
LSLSSRCGTKEKPSGERTFLQQEPNRPLFVIVFEVVQSVPQLLSGSKQTPHLWPSDVNLGRWGVMTARHDLSFFVPPPIFQHRSQKKQRNHGENPKQQRHEEDRHHNTNGQKQ